MCGPVSLQGLLVEELDPTEGNGTGHPRPAADIGAEEEILPQFLIRDQVRGFMVVLSELEDRSGVGLLGAGREASKLHILDHTFAQSAHGRPPVLFGLRLGAHGGSTMLLYWSQLNREEPCRVSGSVQPIVPADGVNAAAALMALREGPTNTVPVRDFVS